MKKRKGWLYALVLGLALVLTVYAWYGTVTLTVTEYTLKYPHLPQGMDGLRIVHLSDLHNMRFGWDNVDLVAMIEAQNPELVVMTGDMISRATTEYDGVLSLGKTLAQRWPVYCVLGNHELGHSEEEKDALVRGLESSGVVVLRDARVRIERNGDSLDLYGMELPLETYGHEVSEEAVQRAIRDGIGYGAVGNFSILLSHNPLVFPQYVQWGADLTLCGHVHGGMIRIPGMGGLLSPERRLFPRYDAGVYEQLGQKMVVSRGLGQGAGFRINNPPEVVAITLKKG